MQHIPGLYIADSTGRGRGVFTAQELNKGDLIEICPVIMIPAQQLALIDQTVLYDYYFLWPGDEGLSCIALGYGSIYNHAENPNAAITFDLTSDTIMVLATNDITAGQEIFVNYQGEVENPPELWFDVK
ncbi:MAG: SET domain-containing protein-lysine N-methyltransferase [Saprospiraceae bacterium]|nr:SET domain-containing protein-lysine N-methyltransferase [Saprospiraceae bacterium]